MSTFSVFTQNTEPSTVYAEYIAEAIVARLNGQELTSPQRNLLNFALGSSVVRDTISDLIQKKSNAVDSAQNRVYDGYDGILNEENTALAYKRVGGDRSEIDVFGDIDYATAMEDSPIDQPAGVSPTDILDGGLDTLVKKIDQFIEGAKSFDEVLDDYARVYADVINTNQAWSWYDAIPGGENLTRAQKSSIKQQAVASGLIPDIRVAEVEGMRYGFADFKSAGIVKGIQCLPENMWKMSDAEQFKWLDEQNGGSSTGDGSVC